MADNPAVMRVARYSLTGINTGGGNYASGDQVGALAYWDILGESGDKTGKIVHVFGRLNSTDAPELDIIFFNRTTTVSADNSPASFPDYIVEDHYLGFVTVAAANWCADANHDLFSVSKEIGIDWKMEGSIGRIYGAVVSRAAYAPVALSVGIAVEVSKPR